MRNDGPKISPLTFFIHLSCFGRVVRVFLTKKFMPQILSCPIRHEKSGSETGNA